MSPSLVHDWDELNAARDAWRLLRGPARFRVTFDLVGMGWQFLSRHWDELSAWVEAWRRNAA